MDAAEHAVAVVGVGAILPDAPNAQTFWQNVINKRYSISEVPPERWRPEFYYDPDPKAADKSYSKIGGWVRGFEFDWRRFRMPPKVAGAMDEGQQWALTIAADALADYGYPDRPLDTERTAVVLGTAMGGELHYVTNARVIFPEFADALAQVSAFAALPASVRRTITEEWRRRINEAIPEITEDSMPGELPNIVSGRVANVLNLRGPNFITDAACASSFAAIQAAVEMLSEHQVDAVVAGGVDRNMGASSFVKFCKIGALSATGSRPFGDGADGFVMGEGAGIFILKRLADAEQAGDRIYVVIRGVGGASDGKGKGITAPNPIGQQLAIRRAWEHAGLDPATATLIEAHGTSTRVGDVVEVESLANVFQAAPRNSIGLGSVKSNIGHLKAGAGAAGLLKAVLATHHKLLPPTLNAVRSNPNIDFRETPFFLIHEPRPWDKANGDPRRCGVSAYGFGGANFHIVLEEHVPGMLSRPARNFQGVTVSARMGDEQQVNPVASSAAQRPLPVRGILALGAETPAALKERLDETIARAETGWVPPPALPTDEVLKARERLIVDFGDGPELREQLRRAQRAMGFDTLQAWKAVEAQGIFRGSGPAKGKIAFMFPGQGSQYPNMGRKLVDISPSVAEVFADADRVMTPILGRPLTDYIFVDETDQAAMMRAQFDLMKTEVTQPAMLTLDMALFRLLADYGFQPDMVIGHSLGEYAALIAAGIMPFAEALEAAAARGSEMSKVSVDDNGKMAAVLAPFEVVQETLSRVKGYVVPANINSHSQSVIGGAGAAVEEAVRLFEELGYKAMILPVSHAFHTSIVAPASQPLRQVLDRLHIGSPRLPLVANVTGDFYPTDVEAIKDLLQTQVAAPVQWVKGLETLYAAGARMFVEVGPKRALHGFANDVFKGRDDVQALLTNHPKSGELASFNQALCGLYAAGYGVAVEPETIPERSGEHKKTDDRPAAEVAAGTRRSEMTTNRVGELPFSIEELGQAFGRALQQAGGQFAPASSTATAAYDRNATPLGSVVISGAGLGLPGAEKSVMDPDNAIRILRGEQFVDLIPARFRQRMVDKRIVRLVKSSDGSGSFATIDDASEVIKLAGRPGRFDLHEEYGVPEELIEALDISTQLAMAAGLDALREAGIPLVQTYKKTTTGKYLPHNWMLPEALRDETGVIFASAFPGGDRFADEFRRYYDFRNRQEQLEALEDLRRYTTDEATLAEIGRRITMLREELEAEPYYFDRRFLFRILSMGHSQFAQYIGARGPNTHVNAACASTTQAVAIAEDWIRSGRCRRVIVIGADNVTGDNLMEWVGAGFLAVGAATTQDRVEEAALPFDRRRHGTIMGMGACALVVESEDALRERGMRGIVELLSSETSNSAFHGTRLDVEHISQVMNSLVTAAERRFGLHRHAIAPQTVFVSHETYTPARGGSASAEVVALREVFGESANEIIIANTKGFTGHPMGVGVEDVIAVKILEHGIVPPVPNFKEIDPELGPLNFSRGGRYPVHYSIHLAAGFGSQIALTLTRRIPGNLDRIDSPPQYNRWLSDISGYDWAETEVVNRVLRIKANGQSTRQPAASRWQSGVGPAVRALAGAGERPGGMPARINLGGMELPLPARETNGRVATAPAATAPRPAPVAPSPEPAPVPLFVEMTPPSTAAPETRDMPAPEPLVTPAAEEAADNVAAQVLALVAQQTGYPEDMLDLDLDLEADLGIDTVKQAETFAAIREAFDIPRRDDLRLSEYNTLEKVIGFVREMRPAPAAKSAPAMMPEPAVPVAPIVEIDSSSSAPQPGGDPVAAQVLAIVAAQTGYPEDMLDLDLDLEADLGIDTVKQAETFVAIRGAFDIPRRDDLSLSAYNTLEKVIAFVREMRPDLAAASPAITVPEPVAARTAGANTAQPAEEMEGDPVAAQVLAIVAAQTGYPEDMLDLDLDLEADLGIDTVKQAETFVAIRAAFDIPRRDDLSLSAYNTLEKVIAFVREMRPDLNGAGPRVVAPTQELAPIAGAVPQAADLKMADQMPRRVPMPAPRPPIELCKPTGVSIDGNSRVVVMHDQGGVGKALVSRLEKLGATVLAVDDAPPAESLVAQLQLWLQEGPIQGVYWLPALDVEPEIMTMDLEEWREQNRLRVKSLAVVMRELYDDVQSAGSFLVSATRLGGLHGYGPEGAGAPLGGAVAGFTKAYKRERPEALVKVVDFAPGRKTAAPAEQLIAETLFDPGVVEVGYPEAGRYTVTLVEQPAAEGAPGLALDADTVFVVTGAAGGITSAIINDLAAASGGIFYLLDLVPEPDPHDEQIRLFRNDKEALKEHFIAAARAQGERPTPVIIEKQMAAVERAEAALRAIEGVQAAGGAAIYRSVNLLDGEGLAAVVADIRERYGRIDVLVHAGGIEISRSLDDKPQEQFDMVYDIKADGFFSLLRAAGEMPIGATVAFSSVAGRFGNAGQTDYSAANDLLCKLTSSLRRWRPQTRGIAIDWTAWSGIGMATRGSIPRIMEMAGIEMLPPEIGIPTVRRELTAGGFRGEIVAGGALGVLTAEWDESGGLDLDKANAWLAANKRLMVGEITAAHLYGGLQVKTVLDPREQPFLYDHALEGTPVLPGVMGTEAFAEMATLFAPGYQVRAIFDEHLMSLFKFYHQEAQTLHLSSRLYMDRAGELIAECELRSVRDLAKSGLPPQEKVHFTAQVALTPQPLPAPEVMALPGSADGEGLIAAGAIYERYFHGPAYKVLDWVSVAGNRAVGLMATDLPPHTSPADAVELMAPRLIELCFQTVGVWEMRTRKVMALPFYVGNVTVYPQPAGVLGSCRYAIVEAVNGGESFDAWVTDEAGQVIVALRDYRTVQLPGNAEL